MNIKPKTMSFKLEDFFLLLLRYTILFVLAISIVLSIYFAVTGVFDLQAKPKSYSVQNFESKEFINTFKDSLKDNLKESENTNDTNNENTELVKPKKADNSVLKEEIDKQTKLVVDFYGKHGSKLNNLLVAENLLEKTNRLSKVYGEDDAAKIEYAKGQTEFFETVFLNKEVNNLVEEYLKVNGVIDPLTDKPRVERISDGIFVFYANFHQDQLDQRKSFDQQENINAEMKSAGAMFKLYVAAGIFGVFLLISLILVLVKIERNLRFIKVEASTEI